MNDPECYDSSETLSSSDCGSDNLAEEREDG